jgi:hypothetical protein
MIFTLTFGLWSLSAYQITLSPAQNDGRVFYAKRVIDKINVNTPENVLGKPDGKFAEVKPGGELTVVMEEQIVFNTAADDGFVVVQGETPYGLAGLFSFSDEGKTAWQPLWPGSMKNGFKLGTDIFLSIQRTNIIKIANDDPEQALLVDAIAGLASDNK